MIKHGVLFALSLGFLFAFSASADQSSLNPDCPLVDGVVTEGEYAHMYHDELIGMMLRWQAVNDVMYIAIIAPATGNIGTKPNALKKGI